MDRNIVYPGSLPQDTDILQPQRNALVALGQLAEAIMGSGTWIKGLGCIPGSALSVVVQPGHIYTPQPTDAGVYGSLASDGHTIMKWAALKDTATLNTPAPTTAGQSINYLVQIRYLEADGNPAVLPYYNASAPATPLSGPGNAGTAQNTTRNAVCDVQILVGTAATTGTQTTPTAGAGFSPLAVVTVDYGQTTIVSGNIAAHGSAPGNIAMALLGQILTVDGPGCGLSVDTAVTAGALSAPLAWAQRRPFRGAMVRQTSMGSNSVGYFNGLFFPFDTEVYDTDGIFNHNAFVFGSGTCTVDPTTDVFTSSAPHNLHSGDCVSISSSGTMPGGMPYAGDVGFYFVVVLSTTTFKLFNAEGSGAFTGSYYDITSAGTGTLTFGIMGTTQLIVPAGVTKVKMSAFMTGLSNSRYTPQLSLMKNNLTNYAGTVSWKMGQSYGLTDYCTMSLNSGIIPVTGGDIFALYSPGNVVSNAGEQAWFAMEIID